jgi:excisionase family DNA binding protein
MEVLVTAATLNSIEQCTYRCTYPHRLRSMLMRLSPSQSTSTTRDDVRSFPRMPLRRCVRRDIEFDSTQTTLVQGDFGRRRHVRKALSRVSTRTASSTELTKLLYSVTEAAELLSCSRNTVYGLIRSGELVAVYPTSKARISSRALMAFVETKESQARVAREAQRRCW